jgi:hypothetical protein
VFEASSDPIRFSDSNTDTQTTGSRPFFQNIITDIQLVNQNAHDYRQYIQYAPQAQYRLSNFQNSKVPINQIDIQVSWKNRLDGKLYPITMFNCSSVSIKMMLQRKDATV